MKSFEKNARRPLFMGNLAFFIVCNSIVVFLHLRYRPFYLISEILYHGSTGKYTIVIFFFYWI
jgi:hypothetical protein